MAENQKSYIPENNIAAVRFPKKAPPYGNTALLHQTAPPLPGYPGNQAILAQISGQECACEDSRSDESLPIQRTLADVKSAPMKDEPVTAAIQGMPDDIPLTDFVGALLSLNLDTHQFLHLCQLFMRSPGDASSMEDALSAGISIDSNTIVSADFPRPPLPHPSNRSGNHSSAYIMWKRGVVHCMTGFTPLQAIDNLIELTNRLQNYPGAVNAAAAAAIKKQLIILTRLRAAVDSVGNLGTTPEKWQEQIAAFICVAPLLEGLAVPEPFYSIIQALVQHAQTISNTENPPPFIIPGDYVEILKKSHGSSGESGFPTAAAFAVIPLLNAYLYTPSAVGNP